MSKSGQKSAIFRDFHDFDVCSWCHKVDVNDVKFMWCDKVDDDDVNLDD